jgi:hypothetical protein
MYMGTPPPIDGGNNTSTRYRYPIAAVTFGRGATWPLPPVTTRL